jgi:type IV secretory pathway TraG/TraD family ATPase VirD4
MPDEQRLGVQSQITNLLSPFQVEPYAALFGGSTRPTIAEIVAGGKIVYFALPIAEKPKMARVLGTFLKLQYFNEVRRQVLTKIKPSLFLCDEYQMFFTPGKDGDEVFFQVSRQSKHVNIIASQNLAGFRATSSMMESAMNLLGNCSTKIFLRNSHEDTNKFAAAHWGKYLASVRGGTPAGLIGSGAFGESGSDQQAAVVEPEEFARLAIPTSAPAEQSCETLVNLGARAKATWAPLRLRWKVHPILPAEERLAGYQPESESTPALDSTENVAP